MSKYANGQTDHVLMGFHVLKACNEQADIV